MPFVGGPAHGSRDGASDIPGAAVVPFARRSPDDRPQDYPGLAAQRPDRPRDIAGWLSPTGTDPATQGTGAADSAGAARPARPEGPANQAALADGGPAGPTGPVDPVPPAADPCKGVCTCMETTGETTPTAGGPAAGADDGFGGSTLRARADRRQFHRYAGAAVVGALLMQGKIMEVSDMLAASPVQLALDRAEGILGEALAAHEVIPPAHILAQTARLGRGLERLARRRVSDSQWRRLRLVAGRVAVVRADAAFKNGDVAGARALASQAYLAGLATGDGPLCGSAREIGAVTEFYDGRPDEALRLARNGQRHVRSGPVRARLVCQEARALAALGDVGGAARALDHAYDLADEIPPDHWGRPGPSFDEFHPVEVPYNATTAFCLLNRPQAAQEHAELALPRLDGMNAPGFRSVIRLDLALALARAGRLELERVCALATEAIQISWGRTVASVSSRADQLLAATQQHGEVSEVRELAALVREWQRSASEQRPAGGPVTDPMAQAGSGTPAALAAGGVAACAAAVASPRSRAAGAVATARMSPAGQPLPPPRSSGLVPGFGAAAVDPAPGSACTTGHDGSGLACA